MGPPLAFLVAKKSCVIARETHIYNVGAQVVGSGVVGAMGPGFRVVGAVAQGPGWWEPWAQGGGSSGLMVVGAQGPGRLEPRAQGGWSLGPEVFSGKSDRHLNRREPAFFENTAPPYL